MNLGCPGVEKPGASLADEPVLETTAPTCRFRRFTLHHELRGKTAASDVKPAFTNFAMVDSVFSSFQVAVHTAIILIIVILKTVTEGGHCWRFQTPMVVGAHETP